MTKEELAEQLNGREYGNEITKTEALAAKEAGLVVVFGYSDDICVFAGAIDEEIYCYGGLKLLPVKSETGNMWYGIEAAWCPEEPKCSWAYKTDIPHATFDIMKDGELYCRGIVFSIN